MEALILKIKHMHFAPHGLFHHTPTVNTSAQSDAVSGSVFIAHAKVSTLWTHNGLIIVEKDL